MNTNTLDTTTMPSIQTTDNSVWMMTDLETANHLATAMFQLGLATSVYPVVNSRSEKYVVCGLYQ